MAPIAVLLGILMVSAAASAGAREFETDVVETSAGKLEITFIGHGTLMFTFDGKVIHVDPYGRLADYSSLPKADLVLITHQHPDHLDPEALAKVRTPETIVIANSAAAGAVEGATAMGNGDVRTVAGIRIEAVPAYNLVHVRDNGEPFHPKGVGNGYVLTFGDTRVYVAGDTENISEMADLRDIDYAFLPMNLPYTMTPEMAAEAARAFHPRVLYPYHYGDTDPERLVELLKGDDIEVRIRPMR